MFKTAEILVVGSEFFTRFKRDSNSVWLTEQLERRGVRVVAKRTVADDLEALTAAFRESAARVDLVISTGGLGPTEDDRTRDAVALAFGRPLVSRPELLEQIAARFALRGRPMSPNNERQALIPEGATALENPNGTAPGFCLEHQHCHVLVLPGPPREMSHLYDVFAAGQIPQYPVGTVLSAARILKVTGIGESDMDALIADLYKDIVNPELTINFTASDLEIHLTARATTVEQAEGLLQPMVAQIAARLKGYLFSEEGASLAEVISQILRSQGLTIAFGESLTGGMAAHRLASVPGASELLAGGVVAYTAPAKEKLLGVSAETLKRFTAVSSEVALEMALGAHRAFGTDIAMSCTGFAGPDGGTAEDPVGTAYLGLYRDGEVKFRRVSVPGDRNLVRSRVVQAMFYWLFQELQAETPSTR